MPKATTFTASLLMPQLPDDAVVTFLACARATLKAMDCTSGTGPRSSKSRGLSKGDSLRVQVTLADDDALGPKVMFTLSPAEPRAGADPERAVKVLGDIVLRSLAVCKADHVVWLDNDTVLERDEFVELRTYVSPRRTATGPRRHADPVEIDGWDTAEVNLARMFREVPADMPAPQPPHSPMDRMQTLMKSRVGFVAGRLETLPKTQLRSSVACWGMTGALGLAVWPVGAALAVNHALRGPDLRLAAQTSALTGLGTALYSSGALGAVLLGHF
ncbi:hypothetical protein [Aestuariicoccus sp. MJ-SS9]|uniref:hypothetical protein n=1 Tax=Aestuariicoccus sp. MJ-SS9 TaxID=3079855 RepID=UPI00290D4DCB|nr:hypothetical protein [Aestuariicoccus sp. MJ-SS9]MDU8913616.1 hypothetical protein [Aestuariicoccus sp. MJ-SS9]